MICTDPRYYLDVPGQICIECPIGCATCKSAIYCYTCQATYIMNGVNMCITNSSNTNTNTEPDSGSNFANNPNIYT